MIWLEYGIAAIAILISGYQLSRFGDVLAAKTGAGRTLIGVIFLAAVTSLPELATGISAVTVAGAPDIAAGDVLGSCVFNLMLIGLIDLFYRPAPILSRVDQGQILSAGFGILLIGITAWGLLIGARAIPFWGLWFGPTTPLILVLYAFAMRRVFRFERQRTASRIIGAPKPSNYVDVPIRTVYRNVAINAAVVMGVGLWLPFIGHQMAQWTGWGDTFVGNLLIAASTSLPEIVISFAALRIAAPDLAVANLFGSNLFNLAILAIDDLAYWPGSLLAHVSINQLFPAVTALMMTGIGIVGLIYRSERKAWAVVSWDGLALLALYILNAYWLFAVGAGPHSP